MNLIESTPAHSNLQNNGAAGRLKGFHPSGIAVTPNGMPIIVVAIIAIRIEPGTLRT